MNCTTCGRPMRPAVCAACGAVNEVCDICAPGGVPCGACGAPMATVSGAEPYAAAPAVQNAPVQTSQNCPPGAQAGFPGAPVYWPVPQTGLGYYGAPAAKAPLGGALLVFIILHCVVVGGQLLNVLVSMALSQDGSMALSLLMMVPGVALTALMLVFISQRSMRFRTMYLVYFILRAISAVLVIGFVVVVVAVLDGVSSFNGFTAPSLGGDGALVTGILVVCLLYAIFSVGPSLCWLIYLFRSKRVKATFPPKGPAAASLPPVYGPSAYGQPVYMPPAYTPSQWPGPPQT